MSSSLSNSSSSHTSNANASIQACFGELEDSRMGGKIRHKLPDIIVPTICAVLCGRTHGVRADTRVDVENFGNGRREWFETFLELSNGIPSHDTFGRVFALLSPTGLEAGFVKRVQSVAQLLEGEAVAIDGKTLRRSYDSASDTAAIHMASAWASRNSMVLGQLKTETKSNEITAIPELLKVLELKGCIVTIDAMGCQKKIAAQIVGQGADYVLGLKGNQSNLHEAVEERFEEVRQQEPQDRGGDDSQGDYSERTEQGHGRIETRRCRIIPADEELPDYKKWESLATLVCIESERTVADGEPTGFDETTTDCRYFISSPDCSAEQMAVAVRLHWGIENFVHWILDVAFREDECRVRTGHAAQNLSLIRRLTLNLLKHEKSAKVGIGAKRLKAAWDDDYLSKVLSSA